jgi:hypothetical protein
LRGSCLLKHVTEGKVDGKIEVMERRGRRHKKLLVTLMKLGDNGKWKKHYIASCGGFALEEATYLL